ncbi:MAG: chorion class high-cysteine HCB protein 13 [Blautia sp.]|nr:chorion class high-cysteine HCB protein 13 [Blautia sp.]MDY4515323.1 chorion class high-cysteine HCB protein 13 [Lachnospiraceae bacterium]
MSDLAATNCGCGCEGVSSNSCNNSGCGFGNNWILWIIILLSCCGNNGCGNGCGFGGDNCCIIIVLLLLCGCGNNGSCFGGCGNC